jgi:hypothetical protein
MSPHKRKKGRLPPPPAEPLRVVNPDAAGIDVHSNQHWVAVPPDRDLEPVRKFGAFTCDLEALVDWLQQCRVTTVVMESTGVHWIPLFELLERRGFRVLLIDPRQAQRAAAGPKPTATTASGSSDGTPMAGSRAPSALTTRSACGAASSDSGRC